MSLARRLLLVAFIESFACILVEQGIYFFCHDRLNFRDQDNLWLAVAFGLAYVVGALASHRFSLLATERRAMLLTVGGQFVCHAVLTIWPTSGAVVFVFSTAIGLLNGAKWPLIESYVSAGQTPTQTARAVGRFNISWAASVPLSLVVVGPLIAWHDSSLFVAAAAMNLVSIWLILPLPTRPTHLAVDHPQRPSPASLRSIRSMLAFSRWTMFASYATLFVVAALMPGIFKTGFGYSADVAAPLASIVHVLRLAAFIVLGLTVRWHHRWAPLAVATVGLPIGFVLILFKTSLAAVIVGEAIFGLTAGLIYYAALYYAMVAENASVGAGGIHEGLIGLGFAVGPGAALAGNLLAPLLGSEALGTLAGTGPLFAACVAGGIIWSVRIARSPTPAEPIAPARG